MSKAPPVPLLPELEQRGRQQRKRPRLITDVRQKGLQLRLYLEPDALRRQDNRAPQLLALHWTDEDVVSCEQSRERRIRRAAPVEVRADCDHDEALVLVGVGGGRQGVDERGSLVIAAAGGEELLELVNHQDEMRVAAGIDSGALQLAHRMFAGPDHDLWPAGAATC